MKYGYNGSVSTLQLTLPVEPLLVLHQLSTNGYSAYIVGGSVRDLLNVTFYTDQTASTLVKQHLVDFDLATSAKPEEILALFPDSFYENQFGTVSITYEHLYEQFGIGAEFLEAKLALLAAAQPVRPERIIDIHQAQKIHHSLQNTSNAQSSPTPASHKLHLPLVEITTYRTQEQYDNGPRRPSSLSWGESLEADLSRRDFTINALGLKIDQKTLQAAADVAEANQVPIGGIALHENSYEIIDLHDGLHDLTTKIVRTVGDPQARFSEDALRMLRAVRLSVQLDFGIESETLAAITPLAKLLSHISAERIRGEFVKMLISDSPKRAIELLDETGLLAEFLPELILCKGVRQSGHHTTDVWTHSLDALQACPSPDPVVKLATLLHDISKPQTYKEDGENVTFYNHEVIGARVAKNIAQRLKFSKKDCDRVFTLVRYHMFHYQPENSDAAIRRLMRKVGLENIDDILDVREADRLGSGAKKTSWRLEELKQRMVEQLNQPFDLSDLAVNGDDLMRELKIPPGKQIGELLSYLFSIVIEQPEKNTPVQLLTVASEWLQSKHST